MDKRIIAVVVSAVLGSAFVITMAGSQFYATEDFDEFIHLNDLSNYLNTLNAWISASSCAYVMIFSRCGKIYTDTLDWLKVNDTQQSSKETQTKSPLSLLLKIIGIPSGAIRGALLGYLGSKTLLKAVHVNSLKAVYGVSIYVAISNTVTFVSFNLGQAIKNTEKALASLKSNDANKISINQDESNGTTKQTLKKVLVVIITIVALVGTFSYFNYQSYNAFHTLPYLENLSNAWSWGAVSTNTILTIIVGGLAKGLQFYRYLTDNENDGSENLNKITSPLIKSHIAVGYVYAFYYLVTTFIGIVAISNPFKMPFGLLIALSALIALCSSLLEYVFSVRIMINDERKRILAEQQEVLPLLNPRVTIATQLTQPVSDVNPSESLVPKTERVEVTPAVSVAAQLPFFNQQCKQVLSEKSVPDVREGLSFCCIS